MNLALTVKPAGMILLKNLQKYYVEWAVLMYTFISSMNFTGEPERRPGSTRVNFAVDIDIVLLDTEAIRVLRRALSIFIELNMKPKGK